MRFSLCKRVDARPQICQTWIDICSLFEDSTRGTRFSNTFTTRQIYKVQATFLLRAIFIYLLVIDDKDGVASRTSIILIGRGNGSWPLTIHKC